MRKAYELIGLPVLDMKSGKRLGRVRDLILDAHWLAQGLLLDENTWFAPARYVPWVEVAAFGDDSVMVLECSSVRKYDPKADHYLLIRCRRKVKGLQGLPLVTEEGVHLGHVEDVYFSQKMEKRIISFELSDGLLNDWREGRKQLPIPVGAAKGEDVILVPVHHLDETNEITEKE